MKDLKLEDNLYWYLLQVAFTSKSYLSKVAEKYGLTVIQFYVLCKLEEGQAVPMNFLCQSLHYDASTLTGIVDKLFSLQYVKREESPKDRRVKMLTLTPKGAEVCKKVFEEIPSHQPKGLASLTETQKQQLAKLLAKILQK